MVRILFPAKKINSPPPGINQVSHASRPAGKQEKSRHAPSTQKRPQIRFGGSKFSNRAIHQRRLLGWAMSHPWSQGTSRGCCGAWWLLIMIVNFTQNSPTPCLWQAPASWHGLMALGQWGGAFGAAVFFSYRPPCSRSERSEASVAARGAGYQANGYVRHQW